MKRIAWCLIFITTAQPCRFAWITFIECPLLSPVAQWNKARFVCCVSCFFLLSYPYSEDSNQGKQYMTTRCPAWCDRILLSTSARDLVLKVSHSPFTFNPVFTSKHQHIPDPQHPPPALCHFTDGGTRCLWTLITSLKPRVHHHTVYVPMLHTGELASS